MLKPGGGTCVVFAPNRLYPFETHGVYIGRRYVFGNIPLVNWLPDVARARLVPHARAYRHGDWERLARSGGTGDRPPRLCLPRLRQRRGAVAPDREHPPRHLLPGRGDAGGPPRPLALRRPEARRRPGRARAGGGRRVTAARLARMRRRRNGGPAPNGDGGRRGLPLRWLIAAVLSLAVFLVLTVAGVTGAAVYGVGQYDEIADSVVPPAQLLDQLPRGGARIYDRHGTLLYEFVDELSGLRRPVPLAEISPWLVQATIATEDQSFFENNGLNVRGLARAALENFTPFGDEFLQGSGGSSITQQLAKNIYIPREERAERSVDRKVKETVIALELTRQYDKGSILEWYLNSISYGGIYVGIEAASEGYFGKPASDLTLPEAALLAGIPQSPARYDPINNLPLAKIRAARRAGPDGALRHDHGRAGRGRRRGGAPLQGEPLRHRGAALRPGPRRAGGRAAIRPRARSTRRGSRSSRRSTSPSSARGSASSSTGSAPSRSSPTVTTAPSSRWTRRTPRSSPTSGAATTSATTSRAATTTSSRRTRPARRSSRSPTWPPS